MPAEPQDYRWALNCPGCGTTAGDEHHPGCQLPEGTIQKKIRVPQETMMGWITQALTGGKLIDVQIKDGYVLHKMDTLIGTMMIYSPCEGIAQLLKIHQGEPGGSEEIPDV